MAGTFRVNLFDHSRKKKLYHNNVLKILQLVLSNLSKLLIQPKFS